MRFNFSIIMAFARVALEHDATGVEVTGLFDRLDSNQSYRMRVGGHCKQGNYARTIAAYA